MGRTASRQNKWRGDYTESCLDDSKVCEAKSDRVGNRQSNFVNYKKQPPRDDAMFRVGDRWANVQLENTKEQREVQMKQQRTSKSQIPSSFRL